MRFAFSVLVALLLAGASPAIWSRGDAPTSTKAERAPLPEIALSELPREARQTLELIKKGGPFPYERDGIVFGNFEKRLPVKERGYYREYTVPTPGLKHRGARRIVAGRGGEYYYTDDHYASFKRIRP